MSRSIHRLARCLIAPGALVLLAGCMTLGGHVRGDFACRAPGGTCAPTSLIDGRATSDLGSPAGANPTLPVRRGTVRAEPGDIARTSERKLRIVFPAHIDGSGIFHEEAVAWTIAEPADWAARARTAPGEPSLKSIARTIGRRLKAGDPASAESATQMVESPGISVQYYDSDAALAPLPSPSSRGDGAIAGVPTPVIEGFATTRPGGRTPRFSGADAAFSDSGLLDSGLPDSGLPDSGHPDSGLPDSGLPQTGLPSPPTHPSTAREAIAGAHAPAIEGFDAPPPRDRTPRSPIGEPLTWPSIEAIDAAHARAGAKDSASPGTTPGAASAAKEPK